MKRWLYRLLLVGLLLSACRSTPTPTATPFVDPGYVLSGSNVSDGFASNALTLFDPETMTVQRRVDLPDSWVRNLNRAPDGTLWIGFAGDMQTSDDQVLVYTAQGDLLHSLHPCEYPEAGISFAAGRAFVACAQDGLVGQVAVIDLETLAVEERLELDLPDGPLLLIASAADERAVLVVGLTSGPEETSYCVATLIDPVSLEIETQIPLGPNTDVWRILPHAGRFFLLNVGSSRQPRDQANDLLVLTPASPPSIEPLALAPAPLWGAFDGEVLYAYHNPTWNSTVSDSRRHLSRLDLNSGQVQVWALPDEWNASDLTVIDGQVLLARWEYWSGDERDGLYRFDPRDGRLSLVLNVADASGVLAPHRGE